MKKVNSPKISQIFLDCDGAALVKVKPNPNMLSDRPETLSKSYYGILKRNYLTEFSTD